MIGECVEGIVGIEPAMNTMFIFFVVVSISIVGCVSSESHKVHGIDQERSITIYTNRKAVVEGLLVQCMKAVAPTGTEAGIVIVDVQNWLQEEIFIAINEQAMFSCTLSSTSKDGHIRHARYGGGKSASIWEDPKEYRLLYKSPQVNGPYHAHGNQITLRGSLPSSVVLTDWIGADGIVSVTLCGYYRSDGRPFRQSVELPLKIGE